MSDSVRPHRRQPTRLPCPGDSPGKNTGVGCHFLLQRMKVKSESEVAQSCPTLSDQIGRASCRESGPPEKSSVPSTSFLETSNCLCLSCLISACQPLDHFLLCWSFSVWSTPSFPSQPEGKVGLPTLTLGGIGGRRRRGQQRMSHADRTSMPGRRTPDKSFWSWD